MGVIFFFGGVRLRVFLEGGGGSSMYFKYPIKTKAQRACFQAPLSSVPPQ